MNATFSHNVPKQLSVSFLCLSFFFPLFRQQKLTQIGILFLGKYTGVQFVCRQRLRSQSNPNLKEYYLTSWNIETLQLQLEEIDPPLCFFFPSDADQ